MQSAECRVQRKIKAGEEQGLGSRKGSGECVVRLEQEPKEKSDARKPFDRLRAGGIGCWGGFTDHRSSAFILPFRQVAQSALSLSKGRPVEIPLCVLRSVFLLFPL